MPNDFDSPFFFAERVTDPSGRQHRQSRPRKSRAAGPKVEEIVKSAIREVFEQEMRAANMQDLTELLRASIAFVEKRKQKAGV